MRQHIYWKKNMHTRKKQTMLKHVFPVQLAQYKPLCSAVQTQELYWHAPDTPLTCPWHAPDMPLTCPWHDPDMPLTRPWYIPKMHDPNKYCINFPTQQLSRTFSCLQVALLLALSISSMLIPVCAHMWTLIDSNAAIWFFHVWKPLRNMLEFTLCNSTLKWTALSKQRHCIMPSIQPVNLQMQ